MERAFSVQPLNSAAAVQRAPRTAVAAPSSADPPMRGTRPLSGGKPPMDSVTISSEAKALDAMPSMGNNDRIQGPRSADGPERAMQVLSELKESFFTKEGDEGFNSRLDFNSDGVINAGDLGVLREKMAGYAPMATPPAQPEPVDEPEEVATLQSIRDAFYTREGEDGFNAASDLNGDGMVNVQDLGLFRQSQASDAQPTQPVPAPLESADDPAATNAAPPSPQSVISEPATSLTINDPAPVSTPSEPTTASGLNVDPATVGIASSADAGNAAPVDAASIQSSLLDQLREAFFSQEGDDRFDSSLDSNGDGRINVADFASVRDSV